MVKVFWPWLLVVLPSSSWTVKVTVSVTFAPAPPPTKTMKVQL